jgi:hypothetical protein
MNGWYFFMLIEWDFCNHCFLHDSSESKAGRLGATLPKHPGPQRQGLLPDECPPTLVRLDQDLLKLEGFLMVNNNKSKNLERLSLAEQILHLRLMQTHRSPSDTVVLELDPRHPCVGQFGLCHC